MWNQKRKGRIIEAEKQRKWWLYCDDGCTNILKLKLTELLKVKNKSGCFNTLIYLFCLFRATSVAHGGSQAGVELELQLRTYTTAHGNARSLTHWVTSWLLVGFVSSAPQRELLIPICFEAYLLNSSLSWLNCLLNLLLKPLCCLPSEFTF